MEKSEKYFFDGQKNPIKNNKFEQKRRFLIFDGFLPPKIRLFPIVSVAGKIRKLSEILL